MFPLYARQGSVRNVIAKKRDPLARPGAGLVLPALKAKYRVRKLRWYRSQYFDYRIDPLEVRCLHEMLADMSARGIRSVVVLPPVEVALLRAAARAKPGQPDRGRLGDGEPGSPLRLFKEAVQGAAARSGVRLIDYMRADRAAGFDYRDPAHLSEISAVRFTRELAASINAELSATERAGHETR
jgi:hypothetical protein